MMPFNNRNNIILVLTACILVSCSGDDGIEGGGLTISGTAATGKPVSQRQIVAKSLGGNKINTITALDGKYLLDIPSSGLAVLQISTETGDVLYSIADASGTINIHPFTDLIVRNWFTVNGLDLDTEFFGDKPFSQLPSATEISAIRTAVNNLIANTLIEFFLPQDIDIISYQFDANGTGFDSFLDYNRVQINTNTISIISTDPKTSIENNIISNIALGTDFTQQDIEKPSTPNSLRALALTIDEVTVIWEAANDNIGVAGYNIYRNGSTTPDATTPHPVFSDTGLLAGVEYCYQVEAIDGAGNVSASKAAITQNCPVTDGNINTTPPSSPTALQAIAQNDGSISVSWSQAVLSDVNGFHVYRGPNGNIDEVNNVATVTSTSYTQYGLDSATEYCFKVTAFGVTSVESILSNQTCATTP